MRSRFLGVAAAWLLGAVTAVGGCTLAVIGLAHALGGPGAQQLTQATVQGHLAGYHAHASQMAATRGGAATGDDGDPETDTSPQRPRVSAVRQPASSRPGAGSGGTLLVSPGGTVMASCQSGLAYLQYWSPDQGYRADDVFRGPALQAGVGFDSPQAEVEIWVTCAASHPVAHLSNDSFGGGNH